MEQTKKQATQPAYLTFRGLPVIFYFQAWQDGKPGLLSPQQLAQVRRNLPPHYLLYMGAEIEFLDVVDGDLMPVDVWWWTWADPSGRGDVITGPDCNSQEQAWQTAMEDFFDHLFES